MRFSTHLSFDHMAVISPVLIVVLRIAVCSIRREGSEPCGVIVLCDVILYESLMRTILVSWLT